MNSGTSEHIYDMYIPKGIKGAYGKMFLKYTFLHGKQLVLPFRCVHFFPWVLKKIHEKHDETDLTIRLYNNFKC